MGKILAKFSLLCWGFVLTFATVLVIAMAIPENLLGVVAIVLGLLILIFVGFILYRNYRRDGLDFGWFFVVKKGYWFGLLGLTGIILLVGGILGEVFPKLFNDLTENSAMNFAKLLVALFWFALISTFLSWSLICFSEAMIYLRLRSFTPAAGSFALGLLWQLFTLLFTHLFLDVINEVFFPISPLIHNRTLLILPILSILAGLVIGKYENPIKLTKDAN